MPPAVDDVLRVIDRAAASRAFERDERVGRCSLRRDHSDKRAFTVARYDDARKAAVTSELTQPRGGVVHIHV